MKVVSRGFISSLNVIRVQIPPLRERSTDIPLLLGHFLQRAADDLQAERKVLLPEVSDFLQTLPWPGNVRQLENVSRWMTVMASGVKLPWMTCLLS